MKERLVRLAKWNQRVFGALLLGVVYLLSIGPASLVFKAARQRPVLGWVPLAKTQLTLEDLKEQS